MALQPLHKQSFNRQAFCVRTWVERMVKVEKTDVRIWTDLNACVSVNTIHPAPEIHEHFMIHKG